MNGKKEGLREILPTVLTPYTTTLDGVVCKSFAPKYRRNSKTPPPMREYRCPKCRRKFADALSLRDHVSYGVCHD